MPSVKELYKKLSDVKIDADSINLNTDGLESLLATTQADIALIKADMANGVLSDVRDGTGNAITSSARGSQRALSVQIVDGSGNQVTSFGSSSVSVSNFPATQPVSGTFWQATQPVSGTVTANTGLTQPLTDTQLRATSVPVSLASVPSHAVTGPLTNTELRATAVPVSLASLPSLVAGSAQIGVVSITQATTSAVTSFSSLTSATLIASNTSRKMLTIQNAGAGILYVLLGSGTASSTNFSVQLNSSDYYENAFYNGQVNAIFASSGTAYVTSLT
jgi:hypothetical protein